ncbi:membrane protein (plasmid) [Sphingomonas sanxanigenens DSM 19645 = NX02]|uniref:Membrane protein n=2 Tax=Sphingomonas sanxanigenens TaxID=397260 RepID=A0A0F7JTT2_9SPHN|nr:membrane protein [Sphingomonas sanxanigenens DSM 19645 = NX02]
MLGTLRRNWGWIVFRGVLALALGVVSFLFPLSALFAFAMVFAGYAGADGILSLVAAVRGARRKEERWWAYVIRGIIGIATAVLFLLMPVAMTAGYALATLIMLAVWAIVTGALEIAAAVTLRKVIRDEWLMGLSGALSVAVGIMIVVLLVIDPLTTLPSAAWVIGTYAIIAGVVLLGLGFKLRRA